MGIYTGLIREIRSDGAGLSAWIDCPAPAIPAAGQYLTAWSPEDAAAALAIALFPAEMEVGGFLAAPTIPSQWGPGMALQLRGPSGKGFRLPANTRRLALAALGDTPARLRPIIIEGLSADLAVALFTDLPVTDLPAAVEIFPAREVAEALSWADLLLLDLPVEKLNTLRKTLQLGADQRLPCPAQALVLTGMPCGGLAECGACFTPARRGWRQACQDGPVFDLSELAW